MSIEKDIFIVVSNILGMTYAASVIAIEDSSRSDSDKKEIRKELDELLKNADSVIKKYH